MISSIAVKLKLEDRQKKMRRRAGLRLAAYFVGWWIRTLCLAAIAPFIIFSFFFWIVSFNDSLTIASVHNVLSEIVTGVTPTPEQRDKGSLGAVLIIALSVASVVCVVCWRVLSSTLCDRICKAAGDSSTSVVLRILLRIKPVWATKEKAKAVLFAVPVIMAIPAILFSGIIVISVFGQDRSVGNSDFPKVSQNKDR